MLARNRPAKLRSVLGIRDLERADVSLLREPRHKTVVNRFRDSHHRIARLYAAGLRHHEVHARSGYSYARIQTLYGDPAFQELISCYRDKVTEAFVTGVDDYYEALTANMLKAERQLSERLDEADENGDTLPVKDLISISRDAADRAGYGKKQTNTNINLDFGKALEAALRRSDKVRTIEAKAVPDRSNPAHAPTELDRRAEPTLPVTQPALKRKI